MSGITYLDPMLMRESRPYTSRGAVIVIQRLNEEGVRSHDSTDEKGHERGREGGRRRRTKGDAIDALLALGDNIAKCATQAASRLIEIAEFFSQIFPLRASDPAGKLVVCSLSLVVDRGGLH